MFSRMRHSMYSTRSTHKVFVDWLLVGAVSHYFYGRSSTNKTSKQRRETLSFVGTFHQQKLRVLTLRHETTTAKAWIETQWNQNPVS
jgi:hypothetical protein